MTDTRWKILQLTSSLSLINLYNKDSLVCIILTAYIGIIYMHMLSNGLVIPVFEFLSNLGEFDLANP